MYSTLFGGIEAFSTQHFQLINGFSNQFFGWGGEDDNLYDRLPSLLVFTRAEFMIIISAHCVSGR